MQDYEACGDVLHKKNLIIFLFNKRLPAGITVKETPLFVSCGAVLVSSAEKGIATP